MKDHPALFLHLHLLCLVPLLFLLLTIQMKGAQSYFTKSQAFLQSCGGQKYRSAGNQRAIIIRSFAIRKKRSSSNNENSDNIKIDPSWTRVDFDKTIKKKTASQTRETASVPSKSKEELDEEEEMEKRLASAQNWEKFLVSDDDALEINKMIGFKEPVERVQKGKISLSSKLSAKSSSASSSASSSSSASLKSKNLSKGRGQVLIDSKKKGFIASSSSSTETDDSNNDLFTLKNIRGFLDMNPFLCTGCGSSFQCKRTDSPGFLPPDKFLLYRQKALLIQKQQKAVQLLNMAGVELTSPTAEEILRDANIEEAVIQGVKRLGNRLRGNEENDDAEERKLSSQRNSYRLNDPRFNLANFAGIINEINPNSNEQKFISTSELDFDLPQGTVDEATTSSTTSSSSSSSSSFEDSAGSVTNEFLNLKRINAITAAEPAAEETLLQADDKSPTPDRKIVNNTLSSQTIEEDDTLPVCQRCFRLQQYGQVEQTLRPGWTENELLTPERFETLLSSIKNVETAVLCIVDIFDLHGSVLPNLKEIVGKNPLYIAVNKLDLLPRDISQVRVTNWVYTEIKRICGFPNYRREDDRDDDRQHQHHQRGGHSSRTTDERGILRQSNIHLISCSNGYGVENLMKELTHTAQLNGKKIHVLGAANVGKSSFINLIMNPSAYRAKDGKSSKYSSKRSRAPAITVSNLPGTTLDFLKIKLSNDITMIDTPGLINKGHLTSRLTTEELKQVIPAKPINAVTLRLEEGKCVLLGGLATVEIVEGKPFFFTFFVSNEVKLHPTNHTRADAFLETHIGKLIFPPNNLDRLKALQPFSPTEFTVYGDGWEQASTDIVIPGLGWIAITGVGSVKVKVSTPIGTEVTLRPALLPFEARHSTARFTGGRIEKKSRKTTKSYGWRA